MELTEEQKSKLKWQVRALGCRAVRNPAAVASQIMGWANRKQRRQQGAAAANMLWRTRAVRFGAVHAAAVPG
jgi:hypothetical protein